MSDPGPMTPQELSRRIASIAAQLRQLTAAPTGAGAAQTAAQHLVPLAAQITAAVAAAVNTADDSLDTGRHNLQTLRALGQRLITAADNALNEPNHDAQ